MNFDSYINEEIDKIKDWIVNTRRDFHMCPELGMEEYETKKKIMNYLEEMKIEYKEILKTGIVGIIRGKKSARTVALRADMDGLPMQDEKDVSYKSRIKGKMHACGHDAHMSILLACAKILKGMEDELNGNVMLIFQPAEETVGGARFMIKEGIMKDVDAIFGLHVHPEIECKSIGIKYDQMNASSDLIKLIIKGTSTHGAYPHTGIDAIYMSGVVINAVQGIVSRNVDPRDCVVISFGKINGGSAGNIICNEVELIGTIRTINNETREAVINKIKNLVKSMCEGMGGTAEIIIEEGYPPLINNNKMVNLIKENAIELLGEKNIIKLKDISLGVEDFSYFLQICSGAFFALGCRNEEKNCIYEGHSSLFDIDEDCLAIGTALQIKNVLKYLGQ